MSWGKRETKGERVRCAQLTTAGNPCRAYALIATYEDEDGPKCLMHQKTPEERSRHASRMARKQAATRRMDVEPKPTADLDPGLTLADVLKVVRPALTATFDHDGSPDHGARLLGCFVLVSAFPRYLRETPERVRELLEQVVPESVFDPERMGAEEVFRAARAEFWSLPGWHPIRGVFRRELPRALVAPWEDYSTVVRREAPALPDESKIRRLEGGRALLGREGQVPLLLEPEEGNGGQMRLSHNIA